METNEDGVLKRRGVSSYRTYEEWKRIYTTQFSIHISLCSYRTYEEWKLEWSGEWVAVVYFVLTVPMRNGNLYPFSTD